MSKEVQKNDKLPKAIYGSDKTPLRLGAIDIPCYVLEDGTRVLSRSGIQKAIGYTGQSGEMLTRFVTKKNGFPDEVVAGVSNSIKFVRVDAGGSRPMTNGYEASLLIDICTSIIDLNRAGVLSPKEQIYAEFADIIVRAVAKVGIIALIDEVTGYQEVRGKDVLQDFLTKYIKDEAGKWVKRFPDEFFSNMFDMKGWTWNYASTKKPGVVGRYINDQVYSRLAPFVLEELRRINPVTDKGRRKTKHHVWLTDEIGHPKLQEHFAVLIALQKASGKNWNNYLRMLNRSLPKYGQTMEMDFPDQDE
jgi:hypothetical protein